MKEYNRNGRVGRAALKASMDRKTAARYLAAHSGPTEQRQQQERHWRTRVDPLAEVWGEAERWLERAPELEAKALFEHLLATQPGKLTERAMRSFYRRVSRWRRLHGAPKEVFFPQVRVPGEIVQVDWTHAEELGVCLGGRKFPHLLCHVVLPYSNWQWAVPCRSESLLSLKAGVQAALWALGGVPRDIQTDHSSTATHPLRRGDPQRGFNGEYLALCAHLGLRPRTINVASPHENGDVESAHGHLKRRLHAHLTLRGSPDFADELVYTAFLAAVCSGANGLRRAKVAEELERLRPLPPQRYPQTEEIAVRVSSYSTVRIKNCAYSVPARLIGAIVRAELSEAEVAIRHDGQEVARYHRSHAQAPQIDYRHLIASLVRKPGAFAQYLYREELFPRLVFRQAYDRLKQHDERRADANYVMLLALAASQEQRVAEVLGALLRASEPPLPARVESELHADPAAVRPIEIIAYSPELGSYDNLLDQEVGT